MSLRLNLSQYSSLRRVRDEPNHLLSERASNEAVNDTVVTRKDSTTCRVAIFLFAAANTKTNQQAAQFRCQVKPFRFESSAETNQHRQANSALSEDKQWIFEKRIECKLQLTGIKLSSNEVEALDSSAGSIESVVLYVSSSEIRWHPDGLFTSDKQIDEAKSNGLFQLND